MSKCSECVVKKARSEKSGGYWWWSVETMKPKFGRSPLTQTHLIKLVRELGRRGHCLTTHEAVTACGICFKTEVDSSD